MICLAYHLMVGTIASGLIDVIMVDYPLVTVGYSLLILHLNHLSSLRIVINSD